MTRIFTWAVTALFLLSSMYSSAQKSTHFGCIGLYAGPSIPLGRLASDEVGKASNGRSGSLYGNYNINKTYGLSLALSGGYNPSKPHFENIKSFFPGIQPNQNSGTISFGSFNFGVIRRLYFASETNNLFIGVNVGVEGNRTPYDMVYFSSQQIFQSNNIQTIFDTNISPVFLFDIGYELFLSRYFSFNSKINYAISNLGTETVSYRTLNGNIDFDPIDFGIAQRLSLQVGLAFQIPNAK